MANPRNILKIYSKMPLFVQQAIFKYKAKKDFRTRYDDVFKKHFKRYKELWHADLDKLQQYQKQCVISLLQEAARWSPWYKEIFNQRSISLEHISKDPLGVLRQLPYLTKTDIRTSLDEIVSTNPDLGKGIPSFTSGTTGSPMKTLASRDSIQIGFALWKRFHDTLGLPFLPRSIRFSGNQIIAVSRKKPPFWMYNPYEHRLFFSIYHLNKDNLSAYICKLNQFKPILLDGYPSSIYVLANYMLNNNISLGFVPSAICTTAEPLTPLIRERIEAAFHCKVYNQYSASEGGVFIAECTNGKMHLHLDSGYVEFLKQDGSQGGPGDTCELVITGFRNFKTPLIRYKTGDWVKLPVTGKDSCSCGTVMPVIDEIFGRIEDYLVDEQGIDQGMVSYRAFKLASNIIKAQIIQTGPLNVLLKIVKDKQYSDTDERFIKQKIAEILGSGMSVDIEYPADIDGGANGKFKTVIKAY